MRLLGEGTDAIKVQVNFFGPVHLLCVMPPTLAVSLCCSVYPNTSLGTRLITYLKSHRLHFKIVEHALSARLRTCSAYTRASTT